MYIGVWGQRSTSYTTADCLPTRSQVIRKIHVRDPNKEFVVINQEIHPGVLVANSIIDSKNRYVLILNTNKEDTIIEAPKLKTENLEDFE